MTLNEYQEHSIRNAIYPNIGNNLIYPILGVCGESGELAEKVKKMLRDDNGLLTLSRRDAIIKELGDVLWYIAAVSWELKITLDEVARINIDKLLSRSERGVRNGDGDNR